MNFKKTWIAFGLILAMLCTGIPVAASSGYRDIAGHWAEGDIAKVSAAGWMNGTDTGVFSPGGSSTRAMMVTILHRVTGKPAANVAAPFKDLKADWYQEAVNWAYETGVVNGTSSTTFSPDNLITRQEIARMVYNYTQKILGHNVSVSGSLDVYPDAANTASWAYDAMLWANANGLIKGQNSGKKNLLNPGGKGTRAELATIFSRFITYQETYQPAPAVKVTVPVFLGMTKDQAIAAASQAGLTANILEEPEATFNGNFAENTVRAQSSDPGTQLDQGSTVTLYLNVKPAPVYLTVPQFVGLNKVAAMELAESLGFKLTFDYKPDTLAESSSILAQSVAQDTVLEKGSVIQLTVNDPRDYSKHLTVVSYNIKCAWYGATWEGVKENIKSVNADIIGLQEVDDDSFRSNSTPGSFTNQVRQLAHDLGYKYWYFSKTLDLKTGGSYGHGIISRFPIKENSSSVVFFQAQDHDPNDGKTDEVRNMERHVLEIGGKELVLYNTHLNGSFKDQFVELMAAAEADYAAGRTVVITGDFNIRYTAMKGYINTDHFLPLNGTDTFKLGVGREATYIDNIIISRNITDYYYDESTGVCVKYLDAEEEDSDHPMIYSHIKLP